MPGSYAILFLTALDFIRYQKHPHLPSDTTEHHFHFGPAASFFVELLVTALCSSPVAYWTPSNLKGSSSSFISFCLFILFMGFSWQEYWRGLPFSHQMDHFFCQNSSLWHNLIGWPCMAWLIASLNYTKGVMIFYPNTYRPLKTKKKESSIV